VAEPEVVEYADAAELAAGVAARLVTRVAEVQATGGTAQICLTGGRIATAVYQRLGTDGVRSTDVDWTELELWWGDERFVPAESGDRNDIPALTALAPLGIAPHRVHPMPADDGSVGLDAAAEQYAADLGSTTLDLCLLGVGPDGHVASLFPDHPSSSTPGRVIAVRDSPKPPPDRISLTLDVINASAEVWFCVSGADKADAVARARAGDTDLPAGRVRATERVVWLLDRAAAGS